MRYNYLSFIVGLFCLMLAGSSCTSYKKIPYFVGQGDTTYKTTNFPAKLVIQKGDQLSIFVSCSDPLGAITFNEPNFSQPTGSGIATSAINNPLMGYIVNLEGNLEFPRLGSIKVAGLSNTQLRDTLQKRLLPYLKDPQVSVRLLNYRISVLGEVNRPGVYVITNDQVSLLEALGMAGDLTIYGRRDNVMIIRHSDSTSTVHRLDLQDKNILQSPYYNLQPGDVVYVTPNKVRENSSDEVLQLLPLGLSILSTFIILIAYLVPKIKI